MYFSEHLFFLTPSWWLAYVLHDNGQMRDRSFTDTFHTFRVFKIARIFD